MSQELNLLRDALTKIAYESTGMREAVETALAALARTHQPEADPIAEGIKTVSASARKSADDGAWKKLFWQVARHLNCLPSSFVDSNDHVLKKARELVVAQQPAQVVPMTFVQMQVERDKAMREQQEKVSCWDFALGIRAAEAFHKIPPVKEQKIPPGFADRLLAVVRIYQEQEAKGIATEAELFKAVQNCM